MRGPRRSDDTCNINLAGYTLVLIKPDEGVSTREAYAGVKPAIPDSPLTKRLSAPIEQWQGSVKNDFEESVFASHPRLARIKQSLLDAGATYAAMSGSGSTIYGIFAEREKAMRMAIETPYIFTL